MSEPKYVVYCAQSGHALFEGTGSQINEFNQASAGAAVHLGMDLNSSQDSITAAPAQKITL